MGEIAVMGGGTMGLDIAQVFARNGFDILVRDIREDITKGPKSA